jgi:hypothetical protein
MTLASDDTIWDSNNVIPKIIADLHPKCTVVGTIDGSAGLKSEKFPRAVARA